MDVNDSPTNFPMIGRGIHSDVTVRIRSSGKNSSNLCVLVIVLNPSNAEATFIQSTRMQRFFGKPPKPCHIGICCKALAEYSQMGTHVPGFQSFFSVFCIIFYRPN